VPFSRPATKLKIGRFIIPVKQTDGMTMLVSGFDNRSTRMLLRLAALSCALFMSAATVSAQPQVPAESRLKGIIANKTIRMPTAATRDRFPSSTTRTSPRLYGRSLSPGHAIDCAAVRAAGPEDRMGPGDRRYPI
jgi:hypothetical protein